ncbi:eCIS core domain-containing protein [Sorangium sp. So ce145]|uniref:eCIS core domain-containing protein n=1 Tax=Sorangium sp. So ce145 TaxID=3133285 RepID=UPI003F632AA3
MRRLAERQRQAPAQSRTSAPLAALERKADHAAERVLATDGPFAASAGSFATSSPRTGAEEGAARGAAHGASPDVVAEVGSAGRPLDDATRSFMEPRFGFEFSRVRIHADERAAASARSLGAAAYTVGDHVVFGAGRWAPGTTAGKELLAHELAHVTQQASGEAPFGALQCRPEDKLPALESTKTWGDYSIAHFKMGDLKIMLGEGVDAKVDRAVLPGIVKVIEDANALITDPAFKIAGCAITNTTSRLVYYQKKPLLLLDMTHVDLETAVHEASHAVFLYYMKSGKAPAAAAPKIVDLYLRLAATKDVEDEERPSSGGVRKASHPAGLWMVDPSQWSKTFTSEHPWDDADEFFASARAAWLTDRKGLRSAIDKFTRLDPAVKAPAAELLELLNNLAGGKTGKALSTTAETKARAELAGISEPRTLEDTLDSMMNQLLKWTLDPSTMGPKTRPAKPALEGPP